MARIICEVTEIELENDDGVAVPSVCVRCPQCEEEQESYGTGHASIRRCLALLRENCPEDGNNFYTTEDDD